MESQIFRKLFNFENQSNSFVKSASFLDVNEISHYTTIEGLKGIIDEKGWWLSDCSYMNDSEELRNGIIILKKLLNDKSINIGKLPHDYILGKIEEYNSFTRNKLFISCFSLESDNLDLWRTYSKGQIGVSITFDVKKKFPFLETIPVISIRKVIYDDELKRKIIRDQLQFFQDAIVECNNEGETFEDWQLEDIADILIQNLQFLFTIFKNQAFSSEKEVRQCFSYRENQNKFDKIHFRSSDKGLIPYFKRYEDNIFNVNPELENHQLPIIRITVGPTLFTNDVIDSIKFYLQSNNYGNIVIIPSNIPYRCKHYS